MGNSLHRGVRIVHNEEDDAARKMKLAYKNIPDPTITAQYGYSCQTWIALHINQNHFRGAHWIWFSLEFNPMGNGDSSNPLWLYLTRDRAVKSGDTNHAEISRLRNNLAFGVDQTIGQSDPALAAQLKASIAAADLAKFRPQIWRLDLTQIAPSRRPKSGNPQWDEYLIKDLLDSERSIAWDIIVE